MHVFSDKFYVFKKTHCRILSATRKIKNLLARYINILNYFKLWFYINMLMLFLHKASGLKLIETEPREYLNLSINY